MSPHTEYRPAFCVPHPDEIFDEPLANYAGEEEIARSKRANKTFLEIAVRDAGDCVPPAEAEKNERDDIRLLEMNRTIVERLAQGGIQMERETQFDMYMYFVHSRRRVLLPQWRRCMFLPWIAKSVRAPMLRALEAFIEKNPFCRMWVFTSGERVPLGPNGETLRKAIVRFHRRLNRLARWMRRELGLELVFRSTELGTPEFHTPRNDADVFDPTAAPEVVESNAGNIEFNAAGEPLFHVHAHVLVRSLRGYIAEPKWSQDDDSVIKRVWRYWGDHWSAGRRGQSSQVRNARELCKYLTKPAEILRLSVGSLVDLYRSLHRLKLVCPLGSLKKAINRRKRRRLRLDRHPTDTGRRFREVDDWNKFGPKTDADRLFDRSNRLSNRPRTDGQPITSAREPEMRIVSRIAARCAPHSCVKEPAVIVMAPRFDEAAVRAHPLVAPVIAATAEQCAAGFAALELIRVHTCTSTGLGESPPATAGPPATASPALSGAPK